MCLIRLFIIYRRPLVNPDISHLILWRIVQATVDVPVPEGSTGSFTCRLLGGRRGGGEPAISGLQYLYNKHKDCSTNTAAFFQKRVRDTHSHCSHQHKTANTNISIDAQVHVPYSMCSIHLACLLIS